MLSVLVLTLALVVTVSADDAKPKKKGERAGGKNAGVAQLLKPFEAVDLTEEQTAKIKVLGKAMNEKSEAIREEAGITQELVKKRAEAMKAARESGKKGKELAAEVDAKAGLSEAQVNAMKKVTELRHKFMQDAVALLTPEQKENLPARVKGAGKEEGKEKGKGKGKKKKDAE
ncbi:Spy/CpxP family protein refolding chaperone [Novipirellula sp. SH528]|uniref:Spy/CpxP family protein refolding chaperone n=1 Tax=Novipirellula sp. SH528 TaxID=3454466 RepID=UPI003F9F005E